MLATALLLAASFVPQTPPPNAPVVINEFSYDDQGTDDYEFVELYNKSNLPVDISGWTLQSLDETGVYGTTVVPNSTVLDPGHFYVLGMAAVPNVDQLLSHTLQDGNETITLLDAMTSPQDSVTYEAWYNTHVSPYPEGQALFDNNTMVEIDFLSWQRSRDGHDTNDNGADFRVMPWTPGTSNNEGLTRSLSTFDSLMPGTAAPGWASSYVDPHAIDPTVVSFDNPNAIPASPQGGNALVLWDSSGGGNVSVFEGKASYDQRLETYVYLDASPLPAVSATDWEAWTIGFGTEGNNFSVPDPGGVWIVPPPTANGNTGVNWTVQRDSTGTTLYLVDNNDGGWVGGTIPVATPPTILASIPIVQGSNDGWQRILLDVSNGGAQLTARFGGTYGQADGQLFTAQLTPLLSGLFVGYREVTPSVPAQLRPPTVDLLSYVSCPPAENQVIGRGTGIVTGTMAISASAAPVVNSTISVDGANMQSGTPAIYVVGTLSATPIGLSLIGGPADAVLRVDPLLTTGTTVDASGNTSLSVMVPNDMSLCGADVAFQIAAIDFTLPVPLKIGLSPALRTSVGM